MNDTQLKELASDLFSTIYAKPKRKRLKPLVKQLTYKGITKKWTEDGQGHFLDFVGKERICYEFAVLEGETNIDFVKRMIDEELERKK